MALNLKDEETVALVAEVARRLGTTKTGAVRELARQKIAELERTDASAAKAASDANIRWLKEEVWPHLAGKTISKEEMEDLLGYNEMIPE